MPFLYGLLLDVGATFNLCGLRAERARLSRELNEGQAEWEAYMATCRRRDRELLGRVWPGYTEELTAARQRHGLA